MRPNGRVIYKNLMRHRKDVFWGRRAFVTVRLPVSVLPVPRPPIDYCKDWGQEIMGGTWVRDLGGGVEEHRRIARVGSGRDPTVDPDCRDAVVHHLTHDARDNWYVWWEGTHIVVRGRGTPDEVQEIAELPVADIDAHRAFCLWHDAYLTGRTAAERGPVLDAFLEVANWAKTRYTDFSDDGRFLYLTYSVAWLYQDCARFSADLKRAFRVAAEHKVDVRLLR